MTLRDALASALHEQADIEGGELFDAHQFTDQDEGDCVRWADAILADLALRAALTDALTDAWWHVVYEGTMDDTPPDDEARDDAGRMVARMLWSRPHATGLA